MPKILTKPRFDTFADVLRRLGVPAHRVLLDPSPGTATVKDVARLVDGDLKRLVELVDGTLVEKTMGARESFLNVELGGLIWLHNNQAGDVAMILGADGMFRLMPKLVRIPDISLTNWDRLPGRKVPTTAMIEIAPDLAIEIISPGNTTKEMARKLKDYFEFGIPVVWFVYPVKRIVRVFASPTLHRDFTTADTLDGGTLLPGFQLPVAKLFEKLGPAVTKQGKKRKK